MKKIVGILFVFVVLFSGCSLFNTEGELTVIIPSDDISVYLNESSEPLEFSGLSKTLVLDEGNHKLIAIRTGDTPVISTVDVIKDDTVTHEIVLPNYTEQYVNDFDTNSAINLTYHGNQTPSTVEGQPVVSIAPNDNTNNSTDRQLKGIYCSYPTIPNTEEFSLYIDIYFNFIDSDQRLFFDFLISPEASTYTAYAYGWNFSTNVTNNITFVDAVTEGPVDNYDISNVATGFHTVSLHVVDSHALFFLEDKLLSATKITSAPTFEAPIKSWFGLENNYDIDQSTFTDSFIVNAITAYY